MTSTFQNQKQNLESARKERVLFPFAHVTESRIERSLIASWMVLSFADIDKNPATYMARLYTAISFGLVLTGLIFHVARGDVYYVASDLSDCRHVEAHASCYTLDHYANSTTLRVNDSVFYFMPGKHLLRRMWNITGARNLTLTSQFPRSDSSESDVVIECTDLIDDGILVSKGQNITMENFAMLRCKRRVLSFTLTHSIKLSDLTINGSKGYVTWCLGITLVQTIYPYRFRLLTLR